VISVVVKHVLSVFGLHHRLNILLLWLGVLFFYCSVVEVFYYFNLRNLITVIHSQHFIPLIQKLTMLPRRNNLTVICALPKMALFLSLLSNNTTFLQSTFFE